MNSYQVLDLLHSILFLKAPYRINLLHSKLDVLLMEDNSPAYMSPKSYSSKFIRHTCAISIALML